MLSEVKVKDTMYQILSALDRIEKQIQMQNVHYRGQEEEDNWIPEDLNEIPYVYVQFTTFKGKRRQLIQMQLGFLGASFGKDNMTQATELQRRFPNADVTRSEGSILLTIKAPTIPTPTELEQALLQVYNNQLILTRREKDGSVWYRIDS